MEKIAVYAGSFDPFTNGHLSIVIDAAEVFDKVYVLIARNTNKKRFSNVEMMRDAIAIVLKQAGLDNCFATILTDGLVADYCKLVGAQYLARGLRNTSDYLYEENIAKINAEINPALKTIYFRASDEVVSSSMVRELFTYGKNVSKYLPEEVLGTIYR